MVRLFPLVLMLAIPLPILAAPPLVDSLSCPAVCRGSSQEILLGGSRLNDPLEVFFFRDGLKATKLATRDGLLSMTVEATKDCALGEYAFRVRTRGGISNLRTLQVTPFPVVAEKEPNNTLSQAQPVELNSSITGTLDAADVDCFAVNLKKGERLSAEVLGVRLGQQLTDTAISITDPDGKVVANVDDTPLFRQDPFASIVASRDGRYVVSVRESGLGSADSGAYLLHLGNFLRPAAVYPAGGQAGQSQTIQIQGDPLGTTSLTVKLPKDDRSFDLFLIDSVGPAAPTANPFRVADYPSLLEPAPGEKPLPPSDWPVAFNGILRQPNEVDSFPFRAKEGDLIHVDVFAYRIGSPMDTILEIRNSSGQVIAANDDDECHDSCVVVSIPKDGVYTASVREKLNKAGPNFIYRIELTAAKPTLTAFLTDAVRKSQDRGTVLLTRGNRALVHLAIKRERFEGNAQLRIEGLPPGVLAIIPPCPPGEYLVPVIFEAAADAPLNGKLLQVEATGYESSQQLPGVFRQRINLVAGPGDSTFHEITIPKLALAVVEEVPYRIDIVAPSRALSPDGTLDVRLRVQRPKGSSEALEVTFPILPPGIEAPGSVIIPGDKNEANVTMISHPTAEWGDWRIVAEAKIASASERGQRDALMVGNNGLGTPVPGARRPRASTSSTLVSSSMTAIRVAEPPITGRFLPSSAEQGKTVQIVCELKGTVPGLTGMKAQLDGLPPRVTLQKAVIAPNGSKITFDLQVDATTPAAEYNSLVCELNGTIDQQAIRYRLGRGGKMRIDIPGGNRTDASGKPLSPLEALRRDAAAPTTVLPKKP